MRKRVPPPTTRRSQRAKRITRHLALMTTAAALVAALWLVIGGDDPLYRLSMATGYAALGYLVAVLALGPLNVLSGRANPVSTHRRRDLGIWGGVLGLLHLAVGLFVHFRGRMWAYFIAPEPRWPWMPIRIDVFGFANWTGAFAGLILLLLLALSNDASLRRLRSSKWKSLQRLNYAAMILVVIHGVAYQAMETRTLPFVVLFAALAITGLSIQLAGYRTTVRKA